MIGFLRHFRKHLLTGNRFSKYLGYAIGEIILVMIGILLALQVNDWNQKRMERVEEKQILANLHEEFLQNKRLLEEFHTGVRGVISHGEALMALSGAEKEEVEAQNLDSLFFNFLPNQELSTSNTSLNNIVQSGKMNLISDPELIKALYAWEAQINLVEKRQGFVNEWNMDFVHLLTDYVSFKEMDAQGGYPWTGASRLETKIVELFHSLRFENYLDNCLFMSQSILEPLKGAEAIADKIIALTGPGPQ